VSKYFDNMKAKITLLLLLITNLIFGQMVIIQKDSAGVEILPSGIRGGFVSKTTDSTNIAIGKNALLNNTLSHRNIAIGIDALKLFNAPNSPNNTAMIAIGHGALSNYNTTGNTLSIAIGKNALGNITQEGSNNIVIGHFSSQNNRGDQKIVIGNRALSSGNTDTDNGTFIGHGVASNAPAGTGNTVIGLNAMRFGGRGRNTIVGDGAGGGTSSSSKIGEGNVMLGHRAGELETGNDKLYIENTNSNTPLIGGDFANDKLGINFPVANMAANFEKLQVGGGIFSNGSIRAQNNVQSQNAFVLSMATLGEKDVCANSEGRLIPCNNSSSSLFTPENVSAMGFHPQTFSSAAANSFQRDIINGFVSFLNDTKQTEAFMYAPVELPSGFPIKTMRFHFRNSTQGSMTVKLMSVPKQNAGPATTMVSLETSSGSGVLETIKSVDPAVIIDNSSNYYFLVLEAGSTWRGTNMALRGVMFSPEADK
jgi:hypothetical protein